MYPPVAATPGPGLRVVVAVPPAVEPVTLAEAKLWSVATNPDDDPLVSDLIVACRRRVESDLGQALITQTRTAFMTAFPAGWGAIDLPYPPLQSVASVRYRGLDGDLGTLDPSLYRYTPGSVPGRVWLPYGSVWPVMVPIRDAVQVTYACGYGDAAADVPMEIRLALRSLIAGNYALRESHFFQQGGMVTTSPLYEAFLDSARHGDYR